MKTTPRSRILILSGLAASLIIFVGFILGLAGPAAAGPQADMSAYLPFVTGWKAVEPVDAYETEFADSIEPWKAVRWQNGTNYDLEHSSGCDSGHCGFLDFEVNTTGTYAIASPLILGPRVPYNIEFRAKLDELRDKAQYGVVFGADWANRPDWDGTACPGDNSDSCFNHYYEFRVRYRDVAGDIFLEYRLRRISGHDGNNVEQGKDLVEWTRAEGVNAEDWVKWDVRYGSRGHITFKANNSELPGSAEDKKYDDPLYFGVFARAGENGDTEARFDKFSIAKE